MRYGASSFGYAWSGSVAQIEFWLNDRRIRFMLPLPDRDDREFTSYMRGSVRYERDPKITAKLWEQACRQRWRALNLAIKAKLESVETGISTFDEEFLSFIVNLDGRTIGETIAPQIAQAYESGKIAQLAIGGGS